ncbi:MAG: hypothetical protein MUE88_03100 [Flavobacteriales bacterium]|jgi:hypothetical protein|nr:hypothetical protein [Flavobacteriales bacterium]
MWQVSLLSGQWTQVPLSLQPLPFGETSGGTGVMVADGQGYWSMNTYLSPSSGSTARLHHTTNDWQDSGPIYATGGIVDVLGSYGTDVVFFRHNASGFYRLRSVKLSNGEATESQFGFVNAYQGYFSEIAPLSDTACIIPVWSLTGTRITKVFPSGSQILDTIAGDVHLSFLNAEEGALVSRTGGDTSIVLLTENGGVDWSVILVDTEHLFDRPAWSSDGTLWLIGAGGWVARTSDTGNTWNMHEVPGAPRLLCIALINMDKAWVGSNEGEVHSTMDGGLTWESWMSNDSLVSNIWAFENVIYAETRYWNTFSYGARKLYMNRLNVGLPQLSPSRSALSIDELGITVQLNDNEILRSVRLIQPNGHEVLSETSTIKLPMSGLANGLYLVQVLTDRRRLVEKLIWQSPY